MMNIIMLKLLSWERYEPELLYTVDCYFRFSPLAGESNGSYQSSEALFISAIFGLFAGGEIYKEGVARLGSKLI